MGLLFCCLQEVRYRNSGNKLIELNTGESYEFHWCGQKKRREAGVGILIKVQPGIDICPPDINDPRIMAIDLKIHGFNIRVVNGYSPTDCGGSTNQKDNFYRSMKAACVTKQKHQKLIVVGDLNAKTHVATYKSCYDGTNIPDDPDCNDNGRRLKSFCRSKKLSMSSTFFDLPMINRYTWYSNDKKTKRINDYVLVEKFVQRYVNDCRVEPEYDFDSDHRLLITTLYTPCTRKARRTVKAPLKKIQPDIKALHNDTLRGHYVEKIDQNLSSITCEDRSTTEMSKTIIEVINKAAAETLPSKKHVPSDKQLWKEDAELNSLLEERTTLSTTSHRHKEITKQIKRRVKRLRNEKLRVEADEVNNHANKRQIEELFRSIKSDNSTFKDTKHKSGCDPEDLKKHFTSHFNKKIAIDEPIELREIPDVIKQLQQIKVDGIKTSAPDFDEVYGILTKLQNGKSSNDLPAGFLKYATGSRDLINELVNLYKTLWETREIPLFWAHSKLVALWKGSSKGTKKDPKAYRGLQIGSTFCKIMVIIIINRLKPWYDMQLQEQQQGFRSGRGTADAIFITKRIQQITDKMKKPIYILFVDLTAAFDHVVRKWIFKSIRQRFPAGADTTLIELLEALYKYTTTSLAEAPNDLFEIILGVRQGGPESPPLYNLFMDYVMRLYIELCKKKNIRFLKLNYRIPSFSTKKNKTNSGNFDLDWIGYADDLELAFMDINNLQRGLDVLDEVFRRFNLTINVPKTKTMIFNYQYINDDPSSYPVTITKLNGIPVENVMKFRYLGDEIKYDEPSTGDSEIELRINLAENKFYEMSRKFFNHKIYLKTRIQILNTIVRSRLTYSCQTWNLNKRQRDRINSCYTSMLRKMIKGGYKRKPGTEWSFVYRNEDLHTICGTEDIDIFTAQQQKKYLAHLSRQPNTCITKRLLFNSNDALKTGRIHTLETIVLATENNTPEEFYRRALNRQI